MADEDHVAPAPVMDLGLAMNFRDQWAGRVDGEKPPPGGRLRHRFRHAVGREDHRRRGRRDLVELAHEHGALRLQALDDVLVVHDLVPDIDRRPVPRERPLDGIDRPHHPGAEAARRAEQNVERRL